ncbi:MAG: lipoyl(octanoyl) transferase LipB [Holosporales bacterium]|jgi:lipoyl(octanoyl) transferase|nr:lipoyl(octanoyl) transferase LipB [Holosporales bacterium]
MRWLYTKHPTDYKYSTDFMDKMARAISSDQYDELLWFLEHPHILTYGALAKPSELLESTNIPVYKTNRGGKYTYHGPGQRIIYTMLNISKRRICVKEYVKILELWCIDALKEVGVQGFIIPDKVGVWVESGPIQKIAAIGIRIINGVTTHGIAININPELAFFKKIIPCGIYEHGVTSLKNLGVDIDLDDFDAVLTKHFPNL